MTLGNQKRMLHDELMIFIYFLAKAPYPTPPKSMGKEIR